MDKSITVKFGYRFYVFLCDDDVIKARSIYAHCTGTLDDFENELEEAGIDYCYDLFI